MACVLWSQVPCAMGLHVCVEPGVHGPVFCGARCHGPVFCGARCHVHVPWAFFVEPGARCHGPVFCGARCHVHVCVCTWACVLWCQVPSGKLKQELHGHFSLVYDLSWSRKDTHLLSASADGTVRLEVWILLLLLFYLQCCSFIISVCVCVCVCVCVLCVCVCVFGDGEGL